MLKETLGARRRRNFLQSLLVTAFALTGIGMAQAQDSAPATPGKISTVYTGDVSNGKKVVSSLNTSDLEPGNVLLFILADAAPVPGASAYPEQIAALRLADCMRPRSEAFCEPLLAADRGSRL